MAERTKTDVICDNILVIAQSIKDGVNLQDCSDQLTHIAVDIGHCTLVETKQIERSMRLMMGTLWKMNYSEYCNAVMEGYAITVRDMLEQLAKTLDIPITDKTESTETKP